MNLVHKKHEVVGGSVGRVAVSFTRGLQFESSEHLFTFNCIGNTKIKKKRFAMALMKQPKKDLDLFKTFLIFLGPTRQTF